MPRYHFNIRSPDDLILDEEGVDLPDAIAAMAEAQADARALMSESVKLGDVVDHQEFEVTDAAGAIVFTYPFRRALNLPA